MSAITPVRLLLALFLSGSYVLPAAGQVKEPPSSAAVTDANWRTVIIPDSELTICTWDEFTGAGRTQSYFSVLRAGSVIAHPKPITYTLKLRHGAFDPLVRVGVAEPALAADADTRVWIVQFIAPPLPETRSALQACGAVIHKYLPEHAYLVHMTPGARDAVAALPFVRWVGPYQPAYRVQPAFRAWARESTAAAVRCNIQVFEAGGAQQAAVAARIAALGGTVVSPNSGKFLLEALLTPAQLLEVARWDEVHYIDRWTPAETDMANVRVVGGADELETVAGYDGTGVRGEVLDSGFNLAHVDFASRPLILHTPVTMDFHGAATSGILFGDGTGDPTARGLLPGGQGIVARFAEWDSRYEHTAELLEDPYYAVFQSTSTGGEWTTEYTSVSADMDAILFDLDFLHCQSQSNTGSQLSRPEAWAKNNVSCGGVRHYDTPELEDDCWCDYASIGPAEDGRIKPDLCFWMDWLRTVGVPGPTDYTDEFGGTSGATPCIAGHFGLFFQMWSEGIFENPVAPGGTVFENRPHQATARAFLINSANPYPFSGVSHDLTRAHQGWGIPSVANIYNRRETTFWVNETELLAAFETFSHPVVVIPGEPMVRFTLVYSDPPGSPAAMQARINDLTLKVTSPAGEVYWGNHGLMEGNWSTPGGEPNTVDTVENVFIAAPEPGYWLVEVIASEVNEDGHVETPELDADFALVVSGVAPPGIVLTLPAPMPDYLVPGQPTPVLLEIRDGSETYVPGSAMLCYSYDGGAFTSVGLEPLGAFQYQGVLPAARCSDAPRFYFSAAGSGGSVMYQPAQGPAEPFSATVATVVNVLLDDFEADLGWTVVSELLTDGAWERGLPADDGTAGDPLADYDGSGQCYLTANRLGNSDLDGGPTRLISPPLDLSGAQSVVLRYARSWANDDQDGDPLDVEVSADDGLTWMLVEHVVNIAPGWVAQEWDLAGVVELTSTMRLRFSAADYPNNSLDEGAIDAVAVIALSCRDVGDLNCDGVLNAFDIDPFVLALSDPAGYAAAYPDCDLSAADVNGDGEVNAFDIDPFVELLSG